MSLSGATDPKVLSAARKLWNYLRMDQPLKKCDCVIAMGSHDIRVAKHAAKLILYEWAPVLVCSGGLGRLTRESWTESEAAKFRQEALRAGVPEERILLEDHSTNTGENLRFSRMLLETHGLQVHSAILVHKPYMERRAFATARQIWPELDVVTTSPPIPFDTYPTLEIPLDDLIQIMVGDFQRVIIYPQTGFQIPQSVSTQVSDAFQFLVNRGFTNHMVKQTQ